MCKSHDARTSSVTENRTETRPHNHVLTISAPAPAEALGRRGGGSRASSRLRTATGRAVAVLSIAPASGARHGSVTLGG